MRRRSPLTWPVRKMRLFVLLLVALPLLLLLLPLLLLPRVLLVVVRVQLPIPQAV